MDYTQIEDLLERYWEGETTLEEERQLRQYFAGPTDARFRAVAPLFQALSSEQLTTAPADLGQNIGPAVGSNPHIAVLLERYFEGETTLVEERELKQYFESSQVDAQFQAIAPLFQTLSAAQLEAAPKHIGNTTRPAVSPLRVAFNSRTWYRAAAAAVLVGMIATAVWRLSNNVVTTVGTISQTNDTAVPATNVPTMTVPSPATILAETAIVQAIPEKKVAAKPRRRAVQQQATPIPEAAVVVVQQEQEYTEEDAQKALEELKAALVLVSSKMNKGTKDASKSFGKVNVDQYF